MGFSETLLTHFRHPGWREALETLSAMLESLTLEAQQFAWAEGESATSQMLRAGGRDLGRLAEYLAFLEQDASESTLAPEANRLAVFAGNVARRVRTLAGEIAERVGEEPEDARQVAAGETEAFEPRDVGIRETLFVHLQGESWPEALRRFASMLVTLSLEGLSYSWSELESPVRQEMRAAGLDLDHLGGYLDAVAQEPYESQLDPEDVRLASRAADLAEEVRGIAGEISRLVGPEPPPGRGGTAHGQRSGRPPGAAQPQERPQGDVMTLDEKVGRAIRLLRSERGIQQNELAERSGIAAPMLSRYENGDSVPRLETLARLLHAMGAKFTDLAQALARITQAEGEADPVLAPKDSPRADSAEAKSLKVLLMFQLPGGNWGAGDEALTQTMREYHAFRAFVAEKLEEKKRQAAIKRRAERKQQREKEARELSIEEARKIWESIGADEDRSEENGGDGN